MWSRPRRPDAEFTAFVADHSHRWERLAYLLCGDPDAARDLLQTVLLKAFRRWARIAAVEQPDAYVRRMITNAFLDLRRRPALPTIDLTSSPVGGRESVGAPDLAVGVADRDELVRALARLTPQQRAVLVLRYIDGLDDAAIGRELGCSPATVRTHASRGRDRFAAALGLAAPAVQAISMKESP